MTQVQLIKNQWADGTEQAREDWETVTKQKFRLLPYRFALDGREFASFVMGASYPTHDSKGVVIVLGVLPETYTLEVVDAVRCNGIYDVLTKIVELRVQYGYGLVRGHLDYVIGEEERYQAVVAKVSEELETKLGEGRGIYMKDPAGFERGQDQARCMAMYLNHLRQALKDGWIDLASNMVITEALRTINHEDAQKGRYEDYPIPGLIGGMIHTILYEDRQKEEHQPEGVSDCAFVMDEV